MHLTLHLTGACNFRCSYCYAAPGRSDRMTFETAEQAIGLALDESPANASLGIIFFGGEPLLCRDLIRRIMQHVRKVSTETGRRFHFKITTNGSLLDEEFLTSPETRDIFVALSHDGDRQAHDANRVTASGLSTFFRVEGAAELLLRHKPYSPAMAVVNPSTVHYYADSVQHLFQRGFRYLIFSLNYAANWGESDLKELKRQYERIADWYECETLKESKFYFSPFEGKIGSHIRPGSCARERCELGQRQLSIGPDGRIYPCVQFVGQSDYCLGSVSSGIDQSRRRELFEQTNSEEQACAECAIRSRCNHFCGCLNRQGTGSIERVSPVLCAHERIVIPIADRLGERLFKKRSAMFVQKHYNDYFPLVSLAEDRSAQRN